MKKYRMELLHMFVRTLICDMYNVMQEMKKSAEAEGLLGGEKEQAAFCRKAGRAMVKRAWTGSRMVQTALDYASVPDAEMKEGEESDWELDFKVNAYAEMRERASWKMSDWLDSGDRNDWIEAKSFEEAAESFRKRMLQA